MYRTEFGTLWEKARVGCFERTASKHVYYLGWNRSPAQAVCMRQVLGPGALGRPRGIRWRGRWEGGSGWGILVNLWLTHVNVWQKPVQYCKVISLQLIKINGEKKECIGNSGGEEYWDQDTCCIIEECSEWLGLWKWNRDKDMKVGKENIWKRAFQVERTNPKWKQVWPIGGTEGGCFVWGRVIHWKVREKVSWLAGG